MTDSRPRRICVVVASRANYGRIKAVLEAVRDHPALELQLVVAASALLVRFGPAITVIREDGFEPDRRAYIVIEGENPTTMAKSTGLAIVELATIFEDLAPDVVLTVADRHETLATAVAASYMNIRVAHTQGGEVTGSVDEFVRHAVTKLAHLHFPATALARERVIRMGEDPAFVHHTGCPAMDLVARTDPALDFDPYERYRGAGPVFPLRPREYLLVLQHPVTTEYGQGRAQVAETLAVVADAGLPAVWLWPNVDAGSDEVSAEIRRFRERRPALPIHFFKNFSPEDYIKILAHAGCVLGNSSSGIREGAFLGVPCVNIGTRQQGREHGQNVVDVPHDRAAIAAALARQRAAGRYEPDHRFGDGRAAGRIAELLAGELPPVQKRLAY